MVRPHDVLDACNRLLAPIDSILSVAGDEDTAPLFIVGPPRSGTTLAYQVIVQQLRLAYFTAPFGYFYGAPYALAACVARHTGRPRPVFTSRYGRVPGILAPSEHANFWFRWFPRDGPAGQYVDPTVVEPARFLDMRRAVGGMSRLAGLPMAFKNVYLTMTAGALARIFHRAQFVVVRRNLVHVAQSVLRVREARDDPGGWWSVRPPGYRDWARLPLWQQVARQVHGADHIVRRDLAKYAKTRVVEVSYEELCRDPSSVVARLSSHLSTHGIEPYFDWRCPERFAVAENGGDFSLVPELQSYLDCLEAEAACQTG